MTLKNILGKIEKLEEEIAKTTKVLCELGEMAKEQQIKEYGLKEYGYGLELAEMYSESSFQTCSEILIMLKSDLVGESLISALTSKVISLLSGLHRIREMISVRYKEVMEKRKQSYGEEKTKE